MRFRATEVVDRSTTIVDWSTGRPPWPTGRPVDHTVWAKFAQTVFTSDRPANDFISYFVEVDYPADPWVHLILFQLSNRLQRK